MTRYTKSRKGYYQYIEYHGIECVYFFIHQINLILSNTRYRSKYGVYELKQQFNCDLISQYNTQTRRYQEARKEWVLLGGAEGQRYRPLIYVFLEGVGSLSPPQVYTDIPVHVTSCICALYRHPNIQPFPHLFLDASWLFLDEKGLIFRKYFLYLEYKQNIMRKKPNPIFR